MSFLNALAGYSQGSQDYQKFLMQQQQAQQLNQMRAMQVADMQQQQMRNQQIAQGQLAMYDQGPIAPPPGQSSQPKQPPQDMQAPPQQAPQGLDMSKLDPRMMQQMMRKDPRAFQRGVTDFQQTNQAPQIKPYQSLNSQPAPTQQASMPQIPERPQYDWQSAIQKIKSTGVTDPETIVAILDKQQSRLDADAKQRLASAKEQLGEFDRRDRITESIRHNREMEGIGKQNAGAHEASAGASVTRATSSAQNYSEPEKLTSEGMKLAEELIRAGKPLPGGWSKQGQARGNAILNDMAKTQEGGAGSGSITSGQAQYRADAGSLSAVQKRVDGIELGSAKIGKDIKTMMSTLDKGYAGSVKLVNEPLNAIRRKFSSPELAAFALSSKVVGTEYERLLTGGMLSASQLHAGAAEDAKKLINEDMTPEEIKAIIPVMLNEIENQKQSAKETLLGLRGRMQNGGSKADSGAMTAERWASMKSGDTFTDEKGNTRRKP